MLKILVLFLACSGAICDVISIEEMKNAKPILLEDDPEFQRMFSFLDQNELMDWRIVGGVESEPHSRIYQVGMYIWTASGVGFCGGSLISVRTVMTAAHCVDSRIGNVDLVFGAHNMPPLAADNAIIISTDNIIIHPGWFRSTLLHDIALAILPSALTLNARIGLIALPTNANLNYANENALVSGWGRPSDDVNNISPILREVNSTIISNYPCRLAYAGFVTRTHICLDGLGGRGTCNGDSGGPLVINGTQIGVVSFGSSWGCAHGWPSVYARVTSYLPWIAENRVG